MSDDKRPVIDGWQDLRRYGLELLTGEACAYGERLLFDVNDNGKKLLEDYFSVSITFPPNWNSKVNGKEATGSIMLCREIYLPLSRFILYHIEQVDYIAESWNGELHGHVIEDIPPDEWEMIPQYRIRWNWTRNSKQPQVNGRNVHAFTGRTT